MHLQQALPVSNITTVFARTLQLNFSTLARGSYALNLEVVRGTEPPVLSRRIFTIE